MNSNNYIHVGLASQCGICTEQLVFGDRCIALSSKNGLTHPFAFPEVGYTLTRIDSHLACRLYAGCQTCAKSPEYVPMHYACYCIFIRSCTLGEAEALDRLWILAAWTRPWRGANPNRLQKSQHVLRGEDKAALLEACTIAGLPLLPNLPAELVEFISQMTRHELLWRCTAAIALARQASALSPGSAGTLPLSDVQSWARGGDVVETIPTTAPVSNPTVRIGIDAFGICKVERLQHQPVYDGEISQSVVYTFISGQLLESIAVQTKYGYLRLSIPREQPSLSVWNTPSPLDLSTVVSLAQRPPSAWAYYHAVEIDRLQGLTLFMHDGRIFGVHAHQPAGGTAMEAYERFPAHSRHQIVWVHLPLPKGDRLLVLAAREYRGQSSILLARTQLAGDVFLGMPGAETEGDFGLACAPITLVHVEPRDGLSVPFLGACSRDEDAEVIGEAPKRFPKISHNPLPRDRSTYFSWAPLMDISSARMFFDTTTGFCKGILFRYESGAERVVGQCRPCIDPSELVVDPETVSVQSVMTYGSRQNELRQAKVSFQEGLEDDESWSCHPMEGLMYFWFTHDTVCVQVFA